MTVKLLTEQYLEFLSLTGGSTDLSESTLVKMPHCWKSHVTAHVITNPHTFDGLIPPQGLANSDRAKMNLLLPAQTNHSTNLVRFDPAVEE